MFKEFNLNENFLKENENLANKIQKNLEKWKINDNDWNEPNKLNLSINNCLKIENYINYLKDYLKIIDKMIILNMDLKLKIMNLKNY